MGSIYQLDPVVKRVDASARTAARAEGFCIEDPVGGFFATLGKEKKYYRVARIIRETGIARFGFSFNQQAPEKDWLLNIDFTSQLAFAGRTEADARRLVDALKEETNFDAGMENQVRHWVDDFKRAEALSAAEFIERFLRPELQLKLKAYVTMRALADLLIEFVFLAFTPHEKSRISDPEKINLRSLKVDLKDYGEVELQQFEVDLHCIEGDIRPYLKLPGGDRDPAASIGGQACISVGPPSKPTDLGTTVLIRTPLELGETLEMRVRAIVKSEFSKNVSLHQWQFEMQTTVKDRLLTAIENFALLQGRAPHRPLIGGDTVIKDVERQVECHPPVTERFPKLGYPDEVLVTVSGRLVLEDLARFAASKVDPKDILGWMKGKLKDTANAILLNEPYVNLFDSYEKKVERMTTALVDEATAIGYDLRDPRIHTNLDFEILRDGIVVIPKKGIEFSLAVQECKVVLGIEIRMLIEDREVLGRLFESKQGVLDRILNIIREAVAYELRSVFPDEFYLNFYGSKDKATAVEARLVDSAKKECVKKLGLKQEFDYQSNQDVVKGFEMTTKFTVQPDELWNLFITLAQHRIAFEPLDEKNTGIAVDVHCMVRKVSPDDWLVFVNMKPTPDVIEEHVQKHIQSYLNEVTKRDGISGFLDRPDSVIRQEVQNWVNYKLGKSHGVWVLFTHWLRHSLSRGQPVEDLKKHLATLRSSSERVLDQLGSALVEGQADEIKESEKKFETIRTMIATAERSTGAHDLNPPKEQGRIAEGSERRAGQKLLLDRLDSVEDKDMVQ